MLTALRAQVQSALEQTPVRRKPALRRTDAPEALLATDLPQAAEAAAVEDFIRRITAQGWRVGQQGGWLFMDASIPAPQVTAPPTLAGECGCCISLLQRHPQNGEAADVIRALVKAADAGKQPFERFCTLLHGELAAALRRHEPLPGQLLPYLICAAGRFAP